MAALRKLLARGRSDSGAEFVEFALAFPLLLLVVLGIMDFGMMFQQYEVITNAAREGARVGVLPGFSLANAEARATAYAAQVTGPAIATVLPATTANVPVAGAGSPCITTITVTVTYPHTFMFVGQLMAYFGSPTLGTKILTATSTMRSETVAGGC